MILFALLLAAPVDNVSIDDPHVDCLEIRVTMENVRQTMGIPVDTIDSIYERCVASYGG